MTHRGQKICFKCDYDSTHWEYHNECMHQCGLPDKDKDEKINVYVGYKLVFCSKYKETGKK